MAERVDLHASCVAIDGRAVLIRGCSGSGKSALALQLIAFGGVLVADDRTVVTRQDDQLIAHAPEIRTGQIEARGVGILSTGCLDRAAIRLIVDMEIKETARLPDWHEDYILGLPLPVLRKIDAPHFPAAILVYLKGDRID